MPRKFSDVASQIIAVLPEGAAQDQWQQLFDESFYRAPEVEWMNWDGGQMLIDRQNAERLLSEKELGDILAVWTGINTILSYPKTIDQLLEYLASHPMVTVSMEGATPHERTFSNYDIGTHAVVWSNGVSTNFSDIKKVDFTDKGFTANFGRYKVEYVYV